jgi:hypothetical protein
MLLDYMVPQMSFHEMVRCENQYEKNYDTQTCEQDVHPVLAEQVYLESFAFVVVDGCFTLMAMALLAVAFMAESLM